MVINSLMHALGQEQAIFRVFNQCIFENDRVAAFCSPVKTQQVPYWNSAYLKRPEEPLNRDDLRGLNRAYSQRGIKPHIISTDIRAKKLSADIHTYHFRGAHMLGSDREVIKDQSSPVTVRSFESFDGQVMPAFDMLMRAVFGMKDELMAYFIERVVELASLMPAQIWIAYNVSGEPCGFVNTFQTEDGVNFVFNYAVDAAVQRLGIGTRLMRELVKGSTNPLYLFTNNINVSAKIMPRTGFEDIGNVYLVPLDIYAEHHVE
jgi:hypothetical protein